MLRVDPGLALNADRLRWNARYGPGFSARFEPHPVAVEALAAAGGSGGSGGSVLELACGPSGSALFAAAAGWLVTAVDASEVGLRLLADEAGRRGLAEMITLVHADLTRWRPAPGRYSAVVCTGYWDRELFPAAAAALAPSGVLGWEAYTIEAAGALPAAWCLADGEPATLLPPAWRVLSQTDHPALPGTKRRLLARAA